MKTASTSIPESLRQALTAPTGGIVGLVDELLAASREHGLQLTWGDDHCRVQLGGNELIEVPLRKSVVRAALARVAVVCNQRRTDSVSPYGGRVEISVGQEPAVPIRVDFINTPEIQSLELTPLRENGKSGSQGTD